MEFLGEITEITSAIPQMLSGQKWSAKANVIFFWSMVAYRTECRYGIYSHRVALIDAGHIGQNLYLACTGPGLGTCGVAAISHEHCCKTFELDGNDEYIVYAAPIGTVDHKNDAAEERSIYSFVYDEGL